MSPIKLHVFDFDGTLFRSPEKPVWWKGGWWGNLDSLSDPCVPERPPPEWWNESVVSAAKQAISNPDVLAVLLTGRVSKFSLRLKDLLNQAGLHFDSVQLNGGGPTEAFKMKAIKAILEEHPGIRGVAIWEDRENHLRMLADWIESNGRACTPHLVTVSAHAAECRPPEDEPSATKVAAKYKSKKKDDEGNVHYEYSERQVANRHNQKAERVENLRGDISNLREKVTNDLSAKDPKKYLPALAVALIDETYERVGNAESAADGHYGVTGWLVKHLSFEDGEAVFRYVGKSGVKHEKVVSKAPVVKLLKKLVKGKGKGDQVLELDDFSVKSEDVNAYLKDFKITAKDIRGYGANQEMCKALREVRREGPDLPRARKERDKILKEEFKDALEEVAEIVGHEPATLRSDYLVPGLEDSFMKDGTILATFKSSKAATKTTSEKEDEAVDALIKPSPKLKPPRDDLKKRRIDLGDDDLDSGDDDLSLNFKDGAARVAMALRVAQAFLKVAIVFSTEEAKKKYLEEHPDADADSHTVEESEKGSPAEGEGKPKEKSKKDDSAEARDLASEELDEKAKSLVSAPSLDRGTAAHVDGVLNSLLRSMPEGHAKEFLDGITKARDSDRDALAAGRPPKRTPPDKAKIDDSKKKLDDLNSKVSGLQRELDSGKGNAAEIQAHVKKLTELRDKVGVELQEDFKSYYAHEALKSAARNPLTFIDSDPKPLGKGGAKDRVKASLERFKGMTAEDRAATGAAFKKTVTEAQKERASLEEKLSSGDSSDPNRAEDQKKLESLKSQIEHLDADWRSLEISALVSGDKNAASRIGKGTQALVKALHESGQDVEDIVDSGIGLLGSDPDPKALEDMMMRLKPEHMESALREIDPKMADTWKKLVESGERGKIENAQSIFAALLTDVALEDADPDLAGRAVGEQTKSKTKSEPSDLSGPEDEEEETPPYESPLQDAVGDLVKLDIPVPGEGSSKEPAPEVPRSQQKQDSVERVAARFTSSLFPIRATGSFSSLSHDPLG